MKRVEKYTSFEDLKSSPKTLSDKVLVLAKHENFEKFIKKITSLKHKRVEKSKHEQ